MNSTPLMGIGNGALSTILPGRALVSAGSLAQTAVFPTREAESSSGELPALIQILYVFFRQMANGDFFSEAGAFDDAQFTGQRPIVGVGHHFVV